MSTPASRYFELCQIEGELDDLLVRAFGADPDLAGEGNWPFSHMVYDWYDASFEVWHTRNDFEPTAEQLRAVFALGFARGWICYQDGTEIYVGADGTRGPRHPSVIPRDSEQKYRLAKLEAQNAALRAKLRAADPEGR